MGLSRWAVRLAFRRFSSKVNRAVASAVAVRIEVPAAQRGSFEEILFEGLGELEFSSTTAPDGRLFFGSIRRTSEAALAALEALGASGLLTFEEKSTDWVAESAALRRGGHGRPLSLRPPRWRSRDARASRRPPPVPSRRPRVRHRLARIHASRGAAAPRRGPRAARASSTWAAGRERSRSSRLSRAPRASSRSTSTEKPRSRRASRRARTPSRASPPSRGRSRRSSGGALRRDRGEHDPRGDGAAPRRRSARTSRRRAGSSARASSWSGKGSSKIF